MDKYIYSGNSKFSFWFKQFLPPLIIIGINRIILVLIFYSVEKSQKIRKSKYHISVFNMAHFYTFFNMLIVPGLAVPTGTNVIELV